MDINIENLKEKQYEFLKEHTLNILFIIMYIILSICNRADAQ